MIYLGAASSWTGSSTVKNRSADVEVPAGGGRRRRKTWKRLCTFCNVAGAESIATNTSAGLGRFFGDDAMGESKLFFARCAAFVCKICT